MSDPKPYPHPGDALGTVERDDDSAEGDLSSETDESIGDGKPVPGAGKPISDDGTDADNSEGNDADDSGGDDADTKDDSEAKDDSDAGSDGSGASESESKSNDSDADDSDSDDSGSSDSGSSDQTSQEFKGDDEALMKLDREDDSQSFVDQSVMDFDPDVGVYNGTIVHGTSEIEGPHVGADGEVDEEEQKKFLEEGKEKAKEKGLLDEEGNATDKGQDAKGEGETSESDQDADDSDGGSEEDDSDKKDDD